MTIQQVTAIIKVGSRIVSPWWRTEDLGRSWRSRVADVVETRMAQQIRRRIGVHEEGQGSGAGQVVAQRMRIVHHGTERVVARRAAGAAGRTSAAVRRPFDGRVLESARRRVDVQTRVLLLPFGAPVLEPDLHLLENWIENGIGKLDWIENWIEN